MIMKKMVMNMRETPAIVGLALAAVTDPQTSKKTVVRFPTLNHVVGGPGWLAAGTSARRHGRMKMTMNATISYVCDRSPNMSESSQSFCASQLRMAAGW
jgi:hypothetical protein